MAPIPDFRPSGVLPPYMGDPTSKERSPYPSDLLEFAKRFSDTPHRRKLIAGLLDMRCHLHKLGLVDGVQWLDGSFVESNPTPPGDIDVVTLFAPPWGPTPAAEQAVVAANAHLFDPVQTKAHFHCDAYYVSIARPVRTLVGLTTYWYGLFSHRRVTDEWKGIVQVQLGPVANDSAARQFLEQQGTS